MTNITNITTLHTETLIDTSQSIWLKIIIQSIKTKLEQMCRILINRCKWTVFFDNRYATLIFACLFYNPSALLTACGCHRLWKWHLTIVDVMEYQCVSNNYIQVWWSYRDPLSIKRRNSLVNDIDTFVKTCKLNLQLFQVVNIMTPLFQNRCEEFTMIYDVTWQEDKRL